MKKAVAFIISLIAVLLCACSAAATDNELEALRKSVAEKDAQIVQLQSEILEKDNQLKKFEPFPLILYYSENQFNKGIIINDGFLWAIPRYDSLKLKNITEGMVAEVLFTAEVENAIWLYIKTTPIGDPDSDIGWVRESDIVPYTQDKIKDVKSPLKIKPNSILYDCVEFSDIDTAEQIQFNYIRSVSIEEKKDGYVKIWYSGMNGWVKEEALIYPEVVD